MPLQRPFPPIRSALNSYPVLPRLSNPGRLLVLPFRNLACCHWSVLPRCSWLVGDDTNSDYSPPRRRERSEQREENVGLSFPSSPRTRRRCRECPVFRVRCTPSTCVSAQSAFECL